MLEFLSDHFYFVMILGFVIFAYFNISRSNRKQNEANKFLQKAVSDSEEPESLHPEIDPAKCAGCGACTTACPEGGILQLVNHKAVLVSPTKCVGHGECEKSCPFGAIDLVFGSKTKGKDLPRLSQNYETIIPGLYIAGALGGMGLIRNAIRQGALVGRHALKVLGNEKVDADILIVGAGPAGIATALAAIALKRSYILIDQNSFGGTVYNFPRQKIVMTHPAELPIVGQMKFSQNKISKEELLAYWKKIAQKTGLKIQEQVKFIDLKKLDNIFVVQTSKGELRAKKVALCLGVRGSPRKLGLPNEDLPKVAYELQDAKEHKNQSIAIVGAGNSAVEAAISLCAIELKNKVTVLVRGTKLDRCNEENKNKLLQLEQQGRVQIYFESTVQSISEKEIIVLKSLKPMNLPNDFLFVMAGAELPREFLMGLGVVFDKKFGEKLKKEA